MKQLCQQIYFFYFYVQMYTYLSTRYLYLSINLCILPWCICSELDVETMLKDFSDKLNENLVPDPWDDDTDEQDDDNWFFSLWAGGSLYFLYFFQSFFFRPFKNEFEWIQWFWRWWLWGMNSLEIKMTIDICSLCINHHSFMIIVTVAYFISILHVFFFLFFNICSLWPNLLFHRTPKSRNTHTRSEWIYCSRLKNICLKFSRWK